MHYYISLCKNNTLSQLHSLHLFTFLCSDLYYANWCNIFLSLFIYLWMCMFEWEKSIDIAITSVTLHIHIHTCVITFHILWMHYTIIIITTVIVCSALHAYSKMHILYNMLCSCYVASLFVFVYAHVTTHCPFLLSLHTLLISVTSITFSLLSQI